MAVLGWSTSTLFHLKRTTLEDMDHSITAAQLHKMNEHTNMTVLEEDASQEIASAILIGDCLTKEEGLCEIESASAYGAAIVMPQLARSAGWPIFLTFLTARVWFFLLLNFFVQFNLLYMITREQEVIDAMHGQMFLCNFAAGTRGPHGKEVTPSGTYPWKQWAVRCFLKDSLKRIFPEQAETIESSVDVGEYALESFAARWVCCYIFVLVTTSELTNIFVLARLLYYVPTKPESWLNLNSKGDELLGLTKVCEKRSGTSVTSDSSRAKTHSSRKALGEDEWGRAVSIHIAGMPRAWKIVNTLFVLVPKVMLWKLCNQIGIDFLMETSGIEDLIVNAVAMSFILNFDEMICTVFMSQPTKEVLERCEPFVLYDTVSRENLTHEILRRYGKDQTFGRINWREWHRLIPWKLLVSVAVLGTFVLDYYNRHCEMDHGQIVSSAMHKPISDTYNFWMMMFPNFVDKSAGNTHEQPFWEMPPPSET